MTAVLVATNKTCVSYDILCLAVEYWIVLNHVLNTTHLMHLMKWKLFITYGTRDWSLPPVYVLIMDEISLVQTEQNSSVFFVFFYFQHLFSFTSASVFLPFFFSLVFAFSLSCSASIIDSLLCFFRMLSQKVSFPAAFPCQMASWRELDE